MTIFNVRLLPDRPGGQPSPPGRRPTRRPTRFAAAAALAGFDRLDLLEALLGEPDRRPPVESWQRFATDPSRPVSFQEAGRAAALALHQQGRSAQALARSCRHFSQLADEHARDAVAASTARLPWRLCSAARGCWWILRAATPPAFASHSAARSAVEAVAHREGLADLEARRLGGLLAALDLQALGAGKDVLPSGRLVPLGLPGAAPVLPSASLGYLTFSTASAPAAILTAAGEALDALPSWVREEALVLRRQARAGRPPATSFATEAQAPDPAQVRRLVEVLAGRLRLRLGSDWYAALVARAVDAVGVLGAALVAADAAFAADPRGPA